MNIRHQLRLCMSAVIHEIREADGVEKVRKATGVEVTETQLAYATLFALALLEESAALDTSAAKEPQAG